MNKASGPGVMAQVVFGVGVLILDSESGSWIGLKVACISKEDLRVLLEVLPQVSLGTQTDVGRQTTESDILDKRSITSTGIYSAGVVISYK